MTLANLLKTTRQYFWKLGFNEVEVPYLNTSLPLEPNLYSFQTKNFFLPTSPEFALKHHLSQTKHHCFAISHCFRDLEAESPHHTREFLMLEWYEINQNLTGLMQSVQNYISKFINCKFTYLKLPPVNFKNEPDFNQYFLNEIEPSLPKNEAVFITGYPAFLSPLAEAISDSNNDSEAMFFLERNIRGVSPKGVSTTKKILPHDPPLAVIRTTNFSAHSECEGMSPKVASTAKIGLSGGNVAKRFELYINGIEIANGCTENRDPVSIKHAFEQEQNYRQKNHLPLHPYSNQFISDSASLPPCSGVGLGLNRLNTIINTL